MMLPIKKEQIQIDVEFESPIEAIQFAGDLLVKTNSVEESYVEAMINGYRELGSYIVLAPHIAIPHARPEFGVKEQCLAFLRLKKPISFGHPQNDDVELILPIGGLDKDFHIEMLKKLSALLMNEKAIYILKNSTDIDEIFELFNSERGD